RRGGPMLLAKLIRIHRLFTFRYFGRAYNPCSGTAKRGYSGRPKRNRGRFSPGPVRKFTQVLRSRINARLSSERFMSAINTNHKHELEELVSQQIHVLKNVAPMDDRDIFEYHLRHFRIMALYREIDRIARTMQRRQGWLGSQACRSGVS